ncbi:flagellar hook capping protein [Methyloglobulus morosus KoM1]|uniref:Basal-body rod modification protein FlgD n=1 Tax=Methyloglobulus morosus KoM1 TaxID=1116472 RepID=V5C4F8_9GAMM|nr:flagellar hook assembly protein FlgD [Methyloglobulus morosus]ESS73367.1 flagellar hook capping protein [Methyloglobulus morosus KoM1]
MSAVDAINSLGGVTSAPTGTKKKSLGQDDFLKLMTTQMTHQDPTKPMDNAQFLSQMAQFGTVSGIQDLQQSFKDFAKSISSDQTLQAASLVGHSVSVSSGQGLLAAGGEIKGTFELPSSTSNVNLKITDPVTGDVIRTQSLGEQGAGSMPFSWNGTNDNGNFANPGVYKVQLETNINGVNTVLQPDIQSRVESVSMGSGSNGIQVNLPGLGAVNFNQIKQIL